MYWPFANWRALAGMQGDGWRHSVRRRKRYTPCQKFDATIHSEKNDIPHNSFILQTLISSICMFSRWTIKHPLLLPTLPRSVGISSPTSQFRESLSWRTYSITWSERFARGPPRLNSPISSVSANKRLLHPYRQTWGYSSVAGLLDSSQYTTGRSCDRPSRHRFFWFSSAFKKMLRWFRCSKLLLHASHAVLPI
jgi:hypothetical protein